MPIPLSGPYSSTVSSCAIWLYARRSHVSLGVDQGNGEKVYIRSPPNNNPVKDLTSDSVACNVNNVAVPKTLEVSGGDVITFEYSHNNRGDSVVAASHKGPVMVYVAPTSSNGKGAVWVKLHQEVYTNGQWASDKLIENGGHVSITVPNLAAGEYLFRPEIVTLHEADTAYNANPARGVQLYMECVQFKVVSSGSVSLPAGIDFKTSYTYADKGLVFNLYGSAATSYVAPGGAVSSIAGSNPGIGPVPAAGGNSTANSPTAGDQKTGDDPTSSYAPADGQKTGDDPAVNPTPAGDQGKTNKDPASSPDPKAPVNPAPADGQKKTDDDPASSYAPADDPAANPTPAGDQGKANEDPASPPDPQASVNPAPAGDQKKSGDDPAANPTPAGDQGKANEDPASSPNPQAPVNPAPAGDQKKTDDAPASSYAPADDPKKANDDPAANPTPAGEKTKTGGKMKTGDDPASSGDKKKTDNDPASRPDRNPTTQQTSSGTVAMYAQCGGRSHTGPTQCASGSACKAINEWYSQCV
ncbi:unnamed protein product [Rhizoctonia solani]|uniref:AA9 family lytic polysaccharide monooxygenase n=1 Tax=Rhizoctonia solani TaxID=456999 RepID=A0A8H3AMN4_9AGAM|nr:unnamed protein product [Rhizoctonia solani]